MLSPISKPYITYYFQDFRDFREFQTHACHENILITIINIWTWIRSRYFTTRNNRSYEGDWKNVKPHGFGINSFPNGKIYTGNFDKGKPVGDGQWTYSDGRIYNGTWVNGAFLNKDNTSEVQQYKFITSLINIVVIGAMLSFVIYWLVKVLKIIWAVP